MSIILSAKIEFVSFCHIRGYLSPCKFQTLRPNAWHISKSKRTNILYTGYVQRVLATSALLPCISTSWRSRHTENRRGSARARSEECAGAVRSSTRACSSGAISSSWRGSVCFRSLSRCCLWFSPSCRSHFTCRCAAESVCGRRSIKTCSLPENTRSASSRTRKPTWRWRHSTHIQD